METQVGIEEDTARRREKCAQGKTQQEARQPAAGAARAGGREAAKGGRGGRDGPGVDDGRRAAKNDVEGGCATPQPQRGRS